MKSISFHYYLITLALHTKILVMLAFNTRKTQLRQSPEPTNTVSKQILLVD